MLESAPVLAIKYGFKWYRLFCLHTDCHLFIRVTTCTEIERAWRTADKGQEKSATSPTAHSQCSVGEVGAAVKEVRENDRERENEREGMKVELL